jgi:hypothetical protein
LPSRTGPFLPLPVPAVRPAAMTFWWPSPARAVVSVRPAPPGAWPKPPRT